jgi:hypothetical protein
MQLVFALALLVVSYAITALTAKKPVDAKPARISEFQFPQHEEGVSQPVIFGECWTADWMVLYYGNLSTQAIRAKKSGKK